LKNKKIILTITIVAIIAAFFSSCGNNEEPSMQIIFNTYKDIPGVTESHIDAVNQALENFDYFIYGMTQNAEAFYSLDGEIIGFAKHVTDWLSDLFGIPFIPQIFEFPEIIDGFENGNIHFSGQLTSTPERELIYRMTSPIANRSLTILRSDDAISLREIAQYRAPRFIFFEGTITGALIKNANAFDDFVSIYVETGEKAVYLILNGYADGFVGDGGQAFELQEPGLSVETLYPFVIGTTSFSAQNPDIFVFVEIIQMALESSGMSILGGFYAQGRRDLSMHRLGLLLTDEERIFIENNREIIVAAQGVGYPVSFFSDFYEEFQGVAIDVLSHVETLTGLNFSIINDYSESSVLDIMEKLENGYAHIAAGVLRPGIIEGICYTVEWTDSFYPDNYALLSRADFHNIGVDEILYARVGVIADRVYEQIFSSWFPGHMNIFKYANLGELVHALDSGEVDLAFSSLGGLALLINYYERPGFRANIVFDERYYVSFAIAPGQELLQSILNKAIFVIDTEFISSFWMSRTFDYSFRLLEAQWRTRMPFIISGIVLLIVVAVLAIILYGKTVGENTSLGELVKERTIALEEEIIIRKEKEEEARNASKAKTAFIANMSHEIRTPMNSIIGFSELAMEEDMSSKARSYLSRISDSSNWLLQIINDILDVSKIESGKLELENVQFSFKDIFAACKEAFDPNAAEKELKLSFIQEPFDENKKLIGDPVRIRQVFTNLLSNAIKFTEKGEVKVLARVKKISETRCRVYCEVSDTGIGMTKEQTKKILEPFMQADVSITRKYGGTGLGLSIVKRLVELMDGELQVKSKVGNGSVLSFEISNEMINVTGADSLKTIDVLKQGKPMFKGEVLVCEDNKMNQMVIIDHLSRVGLKTTVAENGNVGIKLIEKSVKTFDLILMDIHMPVKNGLDTAKEMIEMGVKAPIVALTANVMEADKASYIEVGMADCIGKPFVSGELWGVLLKYLKPIKILNEESNIIEGEDDLKEKLSRRFLNDNQNKFEEIIGSCDDKAKCRILIHTLKGSASLLEEKKLKQISGEIEELISNDKHIPTEMWAMLEIELNIVLAKLEILYAKEEKVTGKNIKSEDAKIVLETLEKLLKDKDFESANLTPEISLISGAEGLVKHLEAYDFREALKSLEKLKESWREA